MEQQTIIEDYNEDLKFENIRQLKPLNPNGKCLEEEKKKFIEIISFLDKINFDTNQQNGRPKFYFKDILKSLLIMSYNGMSYRRTESDLIELRDKRIINYIPKRSTLNKYMMLPKTKKIIEKLIEMSSLFFIEHEDTIILDSTWLSPRMYTGGYRKVYDKKSAPLQNLRKLHISCLQNSKIICCARTSKGTVHDNRLFNELVYSPIKNGFIINKLLADAGYTSKDNYAFCQSLNINKVFINFRSNSTTKRAKSKIWKTHLKMFKENPEEWHESYRFRVLVEGVFSTIKRKNLNYLRSKKEIAQDVELLLKCLVYNFTIICRYS
jgi:hypothetical protein